MFSGIGLSEIMVVMLIALVVMGPEKLPDAARQIGKGMRELRRASSMFSDMFMLEDDPNRKEQGAPSARASADSYEPAAQAFNGGESVARSAQKYARSRPVLLANMRRPTHIESVRLTPPVQAPGHDARYVSVELAAARGVGP